MPEVELQPRDEVILREIAHHRLLRSTHLASLVGGSRKALLHRLQRLYHAGYLERPRAQITYYGRGGSEPMAYALGPRGAARLGLERSPKVVRDRLFLEHTLSVADFRVAVGLAAKRRGNIRLIERSEILAGSSAATQKRKRPFRLKVDVSFRGETTRTASEPDGVFGLEFHEWEKRSRAFFLLELDRGTESVIPSSLAPASPLRKMHVYREAWRRWKTGERTPDFGFVDFRVLFVTTSRQRIETMLAANRLVVPDGSRLFLFATEEEVSRAVAGIHVAEQAWRLRRSALRRGGVGPGSAAWTAAQAEHAERVARLETSVFDVPWTNGQGERVRLID